MDATLPSGIKVSTYSPPRDFNPLTADNADLQKAGFPPRPSDPHHLARYNKVLGQLKGKLNYITPRCGTTPTPSTARASGSPTPARRPRRTGLGASFSRRPASRSAGSRATG